MVADEELMREWQRGGAGALEALVQRHHAPLLAHLARLVGDVHLAEDLCQDVFVKLVREGRTYRYPRPFKPWFYTIARHCARNHWQSAYYRHEEVNMDAASAERGGDDPDPAVWFEHLDRQDGLRAALTVLSFAQREVLSLRFGQELSVEETAAVVGVPSGTIKSRTFTALRRLRERLEQLQQDKRTSERTDRRQGDHHHG